MTFIVCIPVMSNFSQGDFVMLIEISFHLKLVAILEVFGGKKKLTLNFYALRVKPYPDYITCIS